MNYQEAFVTLHGHEGDFQNDARDRGNWTSGIIGVGECKGTKFGISAMSFPNEDIANLTIERAMILAKPRYWDSIEADSLPEVIRYDVFDAAYHHGEKKAVMLLQKTVGCAEDGDIGPITISHVAAMHPWEVRCKFDGHRMLFLADISTFDVYGRGWTRRVARNMVR